MSRGGSCRDMGHHGANLGHPGQSGMDGNPRSGDGSSPAESRGRTLVEGLGDQKLMEYSSQNP